MFLPSFLWGFGCVVQHADVSGLKGAAGGGSPDHINKLCVLSCHAVCCRTKPPIRADSCSRPYTEDCHACLPFRNSALLIWFGRSGRSLERVWQVLMFAFIGLGMRALSLACALVGCGGFGGLWSAGFCCSTPGAVVVLLP